jgi:hypothetical protein
LQEITKLTDPAGEQQHLKRAVNSLEGKLRSLKEILPRTNCRSGLINSGGAALKWLFGSANVMDLDELHSTVDALRRKEEAIAHSLDQQVTYLKKLDGFVRFNFQAVTNLSYSLKDVAHKAQEGFQDVAAKLAWGNKKREVASAIKEIEYTLVKLEANVVQLIDTLEFVTLGRIPLNLLKPYMLREMLKNVTVVLPEGYELIGGVNPNNIFLYYVMVQVMVLADLHSFKLELYVPLKTVNRFFALYKIVVFPTRILNNTYAKFEVGQEYLAINLLQRTLQCLILKFQSVMAKMSKFARQAKLSTAWTLIRVP